MRKLLKQLDDIPVWIRKNPSFLYQKVTEGKLELQESDASPQLIDGKWRSPSLSCLDIARLRKNFLVHKKNPMDYVPECIAKKIFPWQWEEEQKVRMVVIEDPKGKRYRQKAARVAYVNEMMAKMPMLVSNWRQEREKQRESTKPKYPF